MKLVICLLFIASAYGAYVPYGEVGKDVVYADKDFLMKQKFIFEVLRNVFDDTYIKEDWKKYTDTYVTDKTMYKDFDDVTRFIESWNNKDWLKKGKVFTIMNERHQKQTYRLFRLLWNSVDFKTFKHNCVWARAHCNEGMFIYALTLTVLHRRTMMKGIILPAIYEIYPNSFFHTDVIYDAYRKKATDAKFGYYDSEYENTVYSNYSDYYNVEKRTCKHCHDYEKLTYFTEDIGLNSYYYYMMMDYPFFMGGDKYGLNKDRRGELYLFINQQLLARYYLERLSNGMGRIKEISWDKTVRTGYFPMMTYHNGLPFTPRMDNYVVPEWDYVKIDEVRDYETRIRRAIDFGFITLEDGKKIDLRTDNGIDKLGNVIQGNPDNKNTRFYRYVDIFARLLLSGHDWKERNFHRVMPGVLMHFETCMRDPVFYQLQKRIIHLYWRYKDNLPKYKTDDLKLDGVEIKKITVDKLMTYFETFDADIGNIVPITDKKFVKDVDVNTWNRVINVRTKRMNHKTFNINVDVKCDTDVTGVVRIFLGPKVDMITRLEDYRKDFVLLDTFKVDLKTGDNKLTRNSRQLRWTVRDRTTYTDLYKKVMKALDGTEKFPLDNTEAHCGFPDRLVLPKGTKGGMTYTLIVAITKWTKPEVEQYSTFDKTVTCGVGSGSRYLDGRNFGFPLDRRVNVHVVETLKNIDMKDVTIFHTDDNLNKVF